MCRRLLCGTPLVCLRAHLYRNTVRVSTVNQYPGTLINNIPTEDTSIGDNPFLAVKRGVRTQKKKKNLSISLYIEPFKSIF